MVNFNDYLYKFTLAINTMQYLFKNIEFIINILKMKI